jgi:flagellar hook-associated protein 3 FlgL
VRVTSGSYFNNIYGENNKINNQLFDVNKQIASGMKIQYAHESPGIFIDTLRLDDEITTLNQVKNSAQNAYKISTQTDTTIGEIVKTLESMKVKMLNAANDTNSEVSMQAIAKEMRGLQNHLLTLSNTSIGGQYLFSGSATSIKPIGTDGTYQGNDKDLQAFLGSGIKQKYNISGSQLFLGDENKIDRTITTNVAQLNLTESYGSSRETFITSSDTIGDLMGNTAAGSAATSYFYIQGTKSDGETFKSKISMNMNDSVNDLLQNISSLYGSDQVNVSLNDRGQIEIVDKQKGSSKLDFHMVGAIDFDAAGADAATVTDIDDLQLGSADFQTAAITTPGLYIKEFIKSGFDPADPANTIEGINYDRTKFESDGAKLLSNTSQIDKTTNEYATSVSKLIDVAGAGSLIGTTLNLQGKNINGDDFDIQIDLTAASSVSGTVNALAITPFDIYNADSGRTVANADQMTYQQLLDVVNMVMSGTLPAANTSADYDAAITAANTQSSTTLDSTGKMVFEDKSNAVTGASLSIYDAASDDYSTTAGNILTFNANSALTIRDPKTDFFTQIEAMIRSVEEGKKHSDGSDPMDPRNLGIQNSIQMIDDLSNHVSRLQTEAGSYSQVLQASSDRADMLIISTKTLQSDIIDTDLAEATLRMQQLSLNYQAMLSSISKVSQLSLVNYL